VKCFRELRIFLFTNNALVTRSFWLQCYRNTYMSDQVAHPYKTTGKVIILYIVTFMFSDNIVKTKEPKTKGTMR